MQFIQAAHYTKTDGRTVDLLVVHDMEAPETHDRAEACARMFATTDRLASAHYCIDDDSEVQCVRDQDVAYAAPGSNSDGLHFEFSGYAAQDRDDWDDPFSRAMLERGSKLFARKAEENRIPAQVLGVDALKAQKRGITTHNFVSLAFHLSTHTDPGASFPLERFVAKVRDHMVAPDDGPADKPDLPTIRPGDVGWLVKKAQKHLNAHGYRVAVSTQFDDATERAVRRFQKAEGLHVDGIIGPRTWRRLRS